MSLSPQGKPDHAVEADPDGGGQCQAGRGRRRRDRLEEERGRWVRQANWMARVTGQSLVRKGQFLTA